MSGVRTSVPACLLLLALASVSCGSPASTPAATPAPPPSAAEPAAHPSERPTAPAEQAIGDLSPDPKRTVRIRGMVTQIVGLRLVPPQVIFKIQDRSGAVTAVIYEQVQLDEGKKLELVGKYHNIPAPTYTGPGEAPREDVFVVERYLDLP